jgi:hypothetical protein
MIAVPELTYSARLELLVYACPEDHSCRKELAERNQRPHAARARSADLLACAPRSDRLLGNAELVVPG